MIIRTANLEDQMQITDCVNKAYEPYIERIGKKPAPMLDDYNTSIKNKHVYVADDGEIVVGIIVLIPQKDHMHLGNLAVLPSKQNKGIGGQLIKFGERLAASAGYQQLRLFTNELMHENITIYKKYGYSEIDRKTEDGYNRVFFVKVIK